MLPLLLALASHLHALPAAPAPSATPAHAEAPVPRLTFDEALGLAAETPAVLAARGAADERRRDASSTSLVTSNPELLLQPRAGGSAPRGASPSGEATLLLSWNLPLALHRREGARLEADEQAALARGVALQRRLDAARAWIDLWTAQATLELASQEKDLALDLAARTERAAASAAVTRADASDAAVYAFEAQAYAFTAEGEVTDLGFALSEKTATSPGRSIGARGPLPKPALPAPEAWPALLDRAASLPDPTAAALSARAERAREAEARAARGWDLKLGARAQRDGAGDAFFGVVGVTLPFLDRGEREAGPLAAQARRREGEAREAAARAATELARALHEVEHTGELLDAIAGALAPAAAESVRLREASLRAGDATVQEVLVARRTAASARARTARAEAAHAWARVKAWLLLEALSRTGAEP